MPESPPLRQGKPVVDAIDVDDKRIVRKHLTPYTRTGRRTVLVHSGRSVVLAKGEGDAQVEASPTVVHSCTSGVGLGESFDSRHKDSPMNVRCQAPCTRQPDAFDTNHSVGTPSGGARRSRDVDSLRAPVPIELEESSLSGVDEPLRRSSAEEMSLLDAPQLPQHVAERLVQQRLEFAAAEELARRPPMTGAEKFSQRFSVAPRGLAGSNLLLHHRPRPVHAIGTATSNVKWDPAFARDAEVGRGAFRFFDEVVERERVLSTQHRLLIRKMARVAA